MKGAQAVPLTFDAHRVEARLSSVYLVLESSSRTPPDPDTAIACLAAGLFLLDHCGIGPEGEARALVVARRVLRAVARSLPAPDGTLPAEPVEGP